MNLTNAQKKYLRSIAHTIHPIVMIGANGLSDNVRDEIDNSLLHHELLKIKIKVEKTEKERIMSEILVHTEAALVQSIGNVIVIYKAFADVPGILLPKK